MLSDEKYKIYKDKDSVKECLAFSHVDIMKLNSKLVFTFDACVV